METKKNKKYDLEHRRPLFFGIGMIISLSLALFAFEWKSEIDTKLDIIVVPPIDFEETIVIPPSRVDPPPPPPKEIEIIEVDNEEPVEDDTPIIDIGTTEGEDIEITIPIPDLPVEKVDDAPVNWASEMPSFEGGMESFYRFLGNELKYPRQAQRIGVEGKVFVQFVVEKDGSLSDVQVLRGIGAGCDEEAIRVMGLVPNFRPGKQGDVRVRVRMVVPISFRLN